MPWRLVAFMLQPASVSFRNYSRQHHEMIRDMEKAQLKASLPKSPATEHAGALS
jgi:hypothetical protein